MKYNLLFAVYRSIFNISIEWFEVIDRLEPVIFMTTLNTWVSWILHVSLNDYRMHTYIHTWDENFIEQILFFTLHTYILKLSKPKTFFFDYLYILKIWARRYYLKTFEWKIVIHCSYYCTIIRRSCIDVLISLFGGSTFFRIL